MATQPDDTTHQDDAPQTDGDAWRLLEQRRDGQRYVALHENEGGYELRTGTVDGLPGTPTERDEEARHGYDTTAAAWHAYARALDESGLAPPRS